MEWVGVGDTSGVFGQLAIVVAAGLLGPLLAAGRRPLAPVLVGELVAGAVIGRTGFNLIDPASQPLPAFQTLGFAMLMLGAGAEVDIGSPTLRRGAARGGLAFLVALAASVLLGLTIAGGLRIGNGPLLIFLLAGSSAAIAFPTIDERGLTGPAVALLIGWITIADAATALLMPLSLTGAGRLLGALAGDVAIVAVAALALLAATRAQGRRFAEEAIRESVQRGWALHLRLSILLLLVLGAIADRSGASLLVAGFAAGIVLRRLHEPHRLALQLTGVANGFFVPAFFVLLGAGLDLRRLAQDPTAIALAVAMALGSVVVHLAAAAIAGRERRAASGLLASAQLGLPAAAAALGTATGALRPAIAAALVAGGVLTLLPATIGAAWLSRSAVEQHPGTRP